MGMSPFPDRRQRSLYSYVSTVGHQHITCTCTYDWTLTTRRWLTWAMLKSYCLWPSPTGSVAIVKQSSNDTFLFLQFSFFPCFYASLFCSSFLTLEQPSFPPIPSIYPFNYVSSRKMIWCSEYLYCQLQFQISLCYFKTFFCLLACIHL